MIIHKIKTLVYNNLLLNNAIFYNIKQNVRQKSQQSQKIRLKSTLYYISAAGVLAVGLSYAAVPLYRMFCQAYSYGGTTSVGHDSAKVQNMSVIKDRELTIKFNADIGASMRWNFKPQQIEIKVAH